MNRDENFARVSASPLLMGKTPEVEEMVADRATLNLSDINMIKDNKVNATQSSSHMLGINSTHSALRESSFKNHHHGDRFIPCRQGSIKYEL